VRTKEKKKPNKIENGEAEAAEKGSKAPSMRGQKIKTKPVRCRVRSEDKDKGETECDPKNEKGLKTKRPKTKNRQKS